MRKLITILLLILITLFSYTCTDRHIHQYKFILYPSGTCVSPLQPLK